MAAYRQTFQQPVLRLLAGCCPSRCISELAPGIQLTYGANSSLVGTSRHKFCNTAAHWTVNRGVGERSSRVFARSYRAMAAVLAPIVAGALEASAGGSLSPARFKGFWRD